MDFSEKVNKETKILKYFPKIKISICPNSPATAPKSLFAYFGIDIHYCLYTLSFKIYKPQYTINRQLQAHNLSFAVLRYRSAGKKEDSNLY